MKPRLSKEKLSALKVGDSLIRSLGGIANHKVVVTEIRNSIITVSTPPDDDQNVNEVIKKTAELLGVGLHKDAKIERPNWTFSLNTGAEIDIELGWDGIVTGSFLSEE